MNFKFSNYLIALRAWSAPASTMPALAAFSYYFYKHFTSNIAVNWTLGALAILGAFIFHMGANLVSDYFDFRQGVDRKETYGSSRLLVDGVMQPKTILWYGVAFLFVGCVLGVFLWRNTGNNLLWIGVAGLVGSFFYYKFKFNALGDLLIFVIFGQLVALGTGFVMTSSLNFTLLLVSAPIGFLVVNILHSNNLRDIKHDGQANIRTQAMVIGLRASKIQYFTLSALAYLFVIGMIICGILSVWSALVLLTVPISIKNCKRITTAEIEKPENIKDMDTESAKLVLMFSLLLILSNFIAGILK